MLEVRSDTGGRKQPGAVLLRWRYSIPRIIITFLIIASRAAALVIFTAAFRIYILLFLIIHGLTTILFTSVLFYINESSHRLDHIVAYSVCSFVGIDLSFIRICQHLDTDICFMWVNHLLAILSNTMLMVCWYIIMGCHQTHGYTTLVVILATTVIAFLADIILRYISNQ